MPLLFVLGMSKNFWWTHNNSPFYIFYILICPIKDVHLWAKFLKKF